MAKKKNQILVEWLKSKDAGERNCVNVKHVVEDAESIIVLERLSLSNLMLDAIK